MALPPGACESAVRVVKLAWHAGRVKRGFRAFAKLAICLDANGDSQEREMNLLSNRNLQLALRGSFAD